MPTMRSGRIDKPDLTVGAPEQVAAPEITVNALRRLRRTGQLLDARADRFNRPALQRVERVEIGLDAVLDVERRPVVVRRMGYREGADVTVGRCTERRHPSAVHSRKSNAES